MDRKAWLEELLGDDLVAVKVCVRDADVVFVKGILEASEGLGAVFAEPRSGEATRTGHDGGRMVIAGPKSRARELHEVIEDLRIELGGALWVDDPTS